MQINLKSNRIENMKRVGMLLFAVILLITSCAEKEHTIYLYATTDVHGNFIGENSLSNVHTFISQKRGEVGENSLFLIDNGDHLQGTNAVYYFNFKDTTGNKHLFTRVVEYMGYDAIAIGNHDIEAGHPVYDKIDAEMEIPYLAANAIDVESGKPYFQEYSIIKKGGVKVAVIGFGNPNISAWLAPSLWEGMEFVPTYPMADSLVKVVRERERPDIVVISVHGGLGSEDSHIPENPALYLASNVKGVDLVIAGHDHRRYVGKVYNGEDSVMVVDGGSRARYLSEVKISFRKKGGKVYDKRVSGQLLDMKDVPQDEEFDDFFSADGKIVEEFENVKVGEITQDLSFEDALDGMSDYMSFVHYVQLKSTGADVSISAPLATKGKIEKGDVLYKNLFDLYRYENQLYVITMSGKELKDYLENSFDMWIRGAGPAYNYDSAMGLNYTVRKSAKKGNRVKISSMADGRDFDLDGTYKVAMTSYRASGAGDLLKNAGIDPSKIEERIIDRYPEIRELIYEYLLEVEVVVPSELSQNPKLGKWNFVK